MKPSPPVLTLLVLAALALAAAGAPPSRPVAETAAELRNLGLAQLENEQAAAAEATFRRLVKMVPADPLGWADLAVAALRQQKDGDAAEAIAQALARAPGRADLLALQGDVLAAAGRTDEALAAYRRAAVAAPDRVEVQYGLYRLAADAGSDEAEAELDRAVRALARLRPENLVVLLQGSQRAIRAGDRALATRALLRVRELLGPEPPAGAAPSLAQALAALERGEVAAARVPALRLENVLRSSNLYRQGLGELSPGILGIPVERFAAEPPPAAFGGPVPVRFAGAALDPAPTAGAALAIGDFDGDGRPDLARLRAAPGGPPRLELRRAVAGFKPAPGPAAPGLAGLLAVDLDNDGRLDLLAYGPGRAAYWRGKGDGSFADATAAWGLGGAGGTAVAALDYDLEGDLDLALAGGRAGAGELLRNPGAAPLEPAGATVLPRLPLRAAGALVASDLDRDGDLDLAVAHAGGIAWLDNLRQGRFADRTAAAGLDRAAAMGPIASMGSADLDNDGRPDLVAAGRGLVAWHNLGGRFAPWPLAGLALGGRPLVAVLAFDADNDGRLDLAAAGPGGVVVLAQRDRLAFVPLPVAGGPRAATALAAADLDGDGDLDLVAAGPAGLNRLANQGGNANHWLSVRLRALLKGNGKNNVDGLGAVLEVRAGSAYQFREATGGATHFGLGRRRQADLLRVVWTNGVPQNRIQPMGDQRVVEEQVLKGSCPFLYAWDGAGFAFVTDLLWGSPIGLPVAPGAWASADPDELVRVDGARPDGEVYRLRVTEELWEAAYFDAVRLWVVDHPREVEVASNLRVVPGRHLPDAVLGSRDLRPVAAAWDGGGEAAAARVARRDEVYAGVPALSTGDAPYQGVAGAPWAFTLDLGEAPARPIRLHLDGWIFPADASLNLAAAQRRDLTYVAPRLEVETAAGWQPLVPEMGMPAGKTKTMVVDTPPLPPGARRLRILSTLWLAWDRIAWTTAPADAEPVVRARLEPAVADLRYRGFSELRRVAPNGPQSYDYARSTLESPWLPFPGRYTRFGDVRELLAQADDRSAILGPGDEIGLEFDASGLPPVPAGWERTLFLESEGWDKDADRNTWEAQHVEPLPFRAMTGYPYAPGETYPETPELRRYLEEWLTREVAPE